MLMPVGRESIKEGMESRKMKSDFRERIMRRMQRDDEMGDIKKGPWKVEEDEVLINHVNKYGPRDWSSIRSKGLLRRTGKSCRLRWVNKLRPNLKTGVKFSAEEERTVIDLQAQFGNKWAKIATFLPGRTDNDVKNFWSSRQKRLARILQTSTPPPPPPPPPLPPSSSSTKSSKTTEEIQTPAFHIIPSLKVPQLSVVSIEEPHLCAYPGAVVEDHRAPPPQDYMYMIPEKKIFPEQEPRISFQPDYPLLMEGQDFIGRLGVPSFLEDEFEHSSRSALGTAEVPILPSFPAQGSSQVSNHETEDIGSLIDDFPPIDLFDQIEQLPSPSEWQLP